MVFLGFTSLTYKIPNDRIRLFLNPLSGDLMKKFLFISSTLVFLLTGLNQGFADKLDDVINSGKLRCGVVLDFPPIGYRDSNNEPAGFDVEYCKDLAKVLEVELEILPLTWAERLPVIVTNRADVVFGATSDTLERAKTVGFTIPYAIYYAQAVVGKNSGIKTFEDMKGKRILCGGKLTFHFSGATVVIPIMPPINGANVMGTPAGIHGGGLFSLAMI